MTYSRRDYMAGKCSLDEYYKQFLEPWVFDRVLGEIGMAALLASTDPHLNDIPLYKWDALAVQVTYKHPQKGWISITLDAYNTLDHWEHTGDTCKHKFRIPAGSSLRVNMREAGEVCFPSICDMVCLFKTAARMLQTGVRQ